MHRQLFNGYSPKTKDEATKRIMNTAASCILLRQICLLLFNDTAECTVIVK